MQFLQRVHHRVQVVAAQCAESLVDEQRVYRQAVAAERGEAERQRQRDQKTLSARQRAGGTCRASLIEVAQQYGERTGLTFQFVAVRQPLQVGVGTVEQLFQHETLGDVPEVLSFLVAKVPAQSVPFQVDLPQFVRAPLFFLDQGDVLGVLFQLYFHAQDGLGRCGTLFLQEAEQLGKALRRIALFHDGSLLQMLFQLDGGQPESGLRGDFFLLEALQLCAHSLDVLAGVGGEGDEACFVRVGMRSIEGCQSGLQLTDVPADGHDAFVSVLRRRRQGRSRLLPGSSSPVSLRRGGLSTPERLRRQSPERRICCPALG